MSTITPSPIGPATTAKRGTMSAADKAKVDALSGTNTGDVTLSGGNPAGWLSLAGQVLTLALVSASQAVAGVVDLAAQTFAGVKTFVAEAVFSAGLVASTVRATSASLMLRSDLGAGSTDVCVRVGTSVADGSVNAGAKLLSVGTGLGGTYTERFFITKFGNMVMPVGAAIYLGGAVSTGAYIYGASVAQLEFGVSNATTFTLTAGNAAMTGTAQLNTGGNARPTANAANRGRLWYSRSAGGAADTVEICLKSAGDTYSWVTIATG